MLKVKEPGLFTTIQDSGRDGYQRYGIPPSGYIDHYSARTSNLLLNNDPSNAVLEIMGEGPTLEVLEPVEVALTGGEFRVSVNEDPVPMWESLYLDKEDTINIGPVNKGLRSYLAISGGIKTKETLKSKSTYQKGKIGGLNGDGKKLRKNDIIKSENKTSDYRKRVIPEEYRPSFKEEETLRVILGPQKHKFTEEGLRTFLESKYEVSSDSDRMGYRLEGPNIEHKSKPEIISDPIPQGAIQIPGNGEPIIMLNDRQTTGGYPKIGAIIQPDIPKIAQTKPGTRITFKEIEQQEARKAYKNTEEKINKLKNEDLIKTSTYRTRIEGKKYLITTREVP